MSRLAIVGSQSLTRHQGELAWYLIEGWILVHQPQEIASGGATGVDSIAEQVALHYGYMEDNPFEGSKQFRVFLPDVPEWNPVGRKGFKQRNQEIVDWLQPGDKLLRISKHEGQVTYGSGYCADRAEEKLGEGSVFRVYV